MNNKLLIAISLSAISFSTSSASLFDVPLAKKCYAVYQELVTIKEAQTTNQCIEKLNRAKSSTESAALHIAEDNSNYNYQLNDAINALRHAQVYNCTDEDKIVEAEIKLTEIKVQLEK